MNGRPYFVMELIRGVPVTEYCDKHTLSTPTDIYSLGVVLYELLTGTTPFAKERLSKVGHDEMRRNIREEDPPRPSHRLSTLDAQTQSTISDQRSAGQLDLIQTIRGELDWIVMKAMEKDLTRRYVTARDSAADIQHYLADEPVLACPPAAGYRLRKFARRNKVALAMATLLNNIPRTNSCLLSLR